MHRLTYSFYQSYEVGSFVMSILQMKTTLREVESLVQIPTARVWI